MSPLSYCTLKSFFANHLWRNHSFFVVNIKHVSSNLHSKWRCFRVSGWGMWIAALRQGVRTLFWDRQWRMNRRGRVYHCPKLITHWLMILSSRLATPFSHSLLLWTHHKSNSGSYTVHDPQVVRKALPRLPGAVWRLFDSVRLFACVLS